MFARIKNYFVYAIVAIASIAITFALTSLYDNLVDDPAVRRDMAVKMVSKAEYAALQAQLQLQMRERQFLDQSLERYKKLSESLLRDKEKLEADAEKKISEDTSEDGARVTQEDIDWRNR